MLSYGQAIVLRNGRYEFYHENKLTYEIDRITTYRVGELLSNICNIDTLQISSLLDMSPFKNEPPTTENRDKTVEWFKDQISKVVEPVTLDFFMNEFNDVLRQHFLIKAQDFYDSDLAESMFLYNPNRKELSIDSFSNCDELFSCVLEETFFLISVAREFAVSLVNSDYKTIEKLFYRYRDTQLIDFKISFDESSRFTNVYKIGNIISLICFEASNLMQFEQVIKECSHCGNFFVPQKKMDEKYCSGMSKINPSLSCKEAAKRIKQQDSLKNSETDRLRRIVYNTLRNRLLSKRAEDDVVYKEYEKMLQQFSSDASEWRKNVISGISSEEDYINWLKSFQKQNK